MHEIELFLLSLKTNFILSMEQCNYYQKTRENSMDWKHNSHLNPTRSSLSLQLENGSFLASDTCLDNIQLDDLVAPTRDCSCFKLPPIRLKAKKLHHRYKNSDLSDKCESVLSGDALPNHQMAIHTNTGKIQQQSHCHSNELNDDLTQQSPCRHNTANKLSVSSIKLEVPVLSFTNQLQDSMQQQVNPNKFQWAVKRLYKKHDWKFNVTRSKSHTGQLKHISWQILWYFLTTAFISISLVCFIECVPNIYVYTYWDNSTFQELVNPPSLASYSISFWLILIYPIYLIINLLFRLEGLTITEMIMHHAIIVASDQPKIMKVIARCSLLSSLWQIFMHCYIRSLRIITPIDCAAITSVLPCFLYLLCWIIVHRRFCALRVIAFIMASSGVILNIYSDQLVMWYKCLTSLAIITFSLFTVILKRISNKPTIGQMACFYFALGLFNILITWPIFVFTSIVTSTEIINWTYLPWDYFIGIGVSYLGITVFVDMSCRKSKRAIRAIQPLCALPICIVYELFWMKRILVMSSVQISSLILITIACLLNAFPTSWQKV
ncbi:Solute carrier family 35 member F4 isoform 2 [Schistosoma japonicum]|uniref:Solute carrier family 35 member F4 isoform 2 n=1 Tax=Schistosoma japonicum TaxID=6182 RepID=A0A4Z2CP02_SCHJA|nr:Solute carrier family 35 member F4 isoform 2 [Schistosoma japonicum]